MTDHLVDNEARERIRSDFATSMWVEAAAGTGKTTVLVSRILAMIETGRSTIDRLLTLTFSEKAAGELVLRIRLGLLASLERSGADARMRERVRAAIVALETARIGTIHGFCADVLREWPIEAGLDPAFKVADDSKMRALRRRALDDVLADALRAPEEGLRRLLSRRSRSDRDLSSMLMRSVETLLEHRDFDAHWTREPFDRAAHIDQIVAAMRPLAALRDRATDRGSGLAMTARELSRFLEELDLREASVPRDHDALEARLIELRRARFWKLRDRSKYFAPNLLREEVLAQRDALAQSIDSFLALADADLAAALRIELEPVFERYRELRQSQSTVDYLDLLLCTRRLLIECPEIRAELAARFDAIFVDEFQDTDPIQLDIVLLLSSDDVGASDPESITPAPGKLFFVGDPKQAVYRFRRADLKTYLRASERLCGRGMERLILRANFRSRPEISKVINRAFEALMGEGGPSQAPYIALSPTRAASGEQPAVIALPVPRPYGERGLNRQAIATSYVDAATAFVAWLLQKSEFRVADPSTGAEVPIEPRHVCLLVRSNREMAPLSAGLRRHGIAHHIAVDASFHQREELYALRAAISAVEYPEDTLSVYAALRGMFFAITDAELLVFRDRTGSLDPLVRYEEMELGPELAPVVEAMAILRELHLHRNVRPFAETLSRFFAAVRAHVTLALAHDGATRLSSMERVLSLARQLELGGALSFREFANALEREAEREEPVESEGSSAMDNAVTITNAHRAKGLEFQVVVLCDPASGESGTLDRWVDPSSRRAMFPIADARPIELTRNAETIQAEQRAELIRLAYVAATRARDVLVIPVCGEQALPSNWLSPLEVAVQPSPETRRQGLGRAPKCPAFGDESIVQSSIDAHERGLVSVRPGFHPDVDAVWWDPHLVDLRPEAREGVVAVEALRAAENDASLAGYLAFRDARARALLEATSRTPFRIRVAQLGRRPSELLEPPRIEQVGATSVARPTGARVRALFRRVLERLEPNDDARTIELRVEGCARALGADDEERDAIRAAALELRAHPFFARATRRNFDVAIPEGERVLEGRIDLWVEEAERTLVVRCLLEADVSEAKKREIAILSKALANHSKKPIEPYVLVV